MWAPVDRATRSTQEICKCLRDNFKLLPQGKSDFDCLTLPVSVEISSTGFLDVKIGYAIRRLLLNFECSYLSERTMPLYFYKVKFCCCYG